MGWQLPPTRSMARFSATSGCLRPCPGLTASLGFLFLVLHSSHGNFSRCFCADENSVKTIRLAILLCNPQKSLASILPAVPLQVVGDGLDHVAVSSPS